MKWTNSSKRQPAKNYYEETDNFNSLIAIKEIRSTNNNLWKAPDPNGFVGWQTIIPSV